MRKGLLILLPLILMISGCKMEVANIEYEETNYETYKIEKGSISTNDSFVGYIEALEQTTVSPKTSGRISQILVKEGEKISAGQLLATLDGEEVNTNYNSASNVLNSTQVLYNNTASMFDSQIKAMEDKINQAASAVELAEKSLEGIETGVEDTKEITNQQVETAKKQVEQAELAVETAKIELDNTTELLSQKEDNIYSNAKNSLAQSKILVTNVRDFVDETLGISKKNKSKNDDFEDYFGAKKTENINIAKDKWNQIDNKYEEWIAKIADIESGNQDKEYIYNTLQETEGILILERELMENMYSLAQASITSRNFTDSQLQNIKSSISTYQDNIEKMILYVEGEFVLGVKGSRQSIDDLNQETILQTDLLQKKYSIAEKQLETAKQTYNQYIAISQGQVNEVNSQKNISEQQKKIAQQQYEEALTQLEVLKKQKESQLSEIQAQMNKIKGDKNSASIQINNTNILAPYDGVVLEKISSLGQVVGAGTPVFSIADNKKLKLKIFVAENNAKNIELNDIVTIKINNDDTIITGNVYYISPQSDILSKRVPIEIKINNEDLSLRLGMYATAYIGGDNIEGYKVPYKYIKYEYGESYIYVNNNEKATKKFINIKGCNNESCVIDGDIKEGDNILYN